MGAPAVALVLASVLALAAALAPGGGRGAAWAQSECVDNVLANGGFENGFSGRGRLAETVADGWTAWYERFPGTGGINYVPDYAPVLRAAGAGGSDVQSGMWSQQMATSGATHTAGLWQRVSVPAGSLLSAGVSVRAWASGKDDPSRSEPPGTYVSLLGLDPTGGTDPNAPTVQWTAPISVTDAWVPLSLEAPVEGDAVTVFLRGQPIEPLAHNVSRWDDACLRVLGPAEGPLPTATRPPRPTRTPAPLPPGTQEAVLSGTQSALDVALFVDVSATAQATAQSAEANDATAAAAAGVLVGPAALAAGQGEGADEAAAVDRSAPWSGLPTGLADEGESTRWEALSTALVDRVGILFLALAALLGGTWLGTRRRGAHDRGGGV